ncbi:hypothetical protein VOLCADRAFT_93652 [Volvox carteri f. nagariensis]|uniref:Uncharacterized protein n=1 Tax=Volvox carteri f. nagariensis TaxID=3068 RepID=D8U2N9_VOLCA|nr:uncharacterized protein VOLCADRAFT_93652 [Volvox carteri f. nagariensis]EFJ45931.1 hypothetical protein VOLCADRAFT_93652 [Volvox carteri f. nagariensis]|eukprot:XP_002953009.1 hypothetical protein VOLCADRAFT_93652 [Volvox carteri f. nagariensis]
MQGWTHEPTAIDLSPPDAMDVAEVVGPGAVPAASVHRAAARLQAAAAAAAAAATAAAATAKSTAFCSEGDGKPFRLTTDWLPSCQQLYRISEEIRHMASSGNLDSSVHAKSVSGVLDVPAAAVAAAAAGVGSSNVPLHTRFKSRFHPAAAAAAGRGDSGGSGGGDGAEGDGERDDEGGMHDRDADGKVAAAAAAATMMPSRCYSPTLLQATLRAVAPFPVVLNPSTWCSRCPCASGARVEGLLRLLALPGGGTHTPFNTDLHHPTPPTAIDHNHHLQSSRQKHDKLDDMTSKGSQNFNSCP